VFYEYGGGMADGNSIANVVTTGSIVVSASQVLKVTQVGGSIGASSFTPMCYNLTGAMVLINDKVVGHLTPTGILSELYLPSGTYSIGFTDALSGTAAGVTFPACTGEVKGYISGILYDIVP
jgi:hypothetical protein